MKRFSTIFLNICQAVPNAFRSVLSYMWMGGAAIIVNSCITNDLPYPVVVPNIVSMEVEGATAVDISYTSRVVTVSLPETQDLRNVVIKSVEIDSEIAQTSVELEGTHDLSEPLDFIITTYQDYDWTIKANRPIQRHFNVDGQVGSSEIDPINFRAVAYVGKNSDLSRVLVTSLKLGPEGLTTYSLKFDKPIDFSWAVEVDVTYFDQTQRWSLYVAETDISVEIQDINPWTCEAYVTSTGVAGRENGFIFRPKGETEWTDVPSEDVTADGGSFVAHIHGLKPNTTYEVCAVCGDEVTSPKEFTTDDATPLPNHSFEHFSLVTGKDYYKWYNPISIEEDGREMFWGTGNGEGPDGVNGTASLGIVLTYPEIGGAPDGNASVRCESKSFAGILACGNIFTGQFAGVIGTTGGKVNYGRPWKTRPKAIKFKMKYNCGVIDIVGSYPPGEVVKVGDNDRCHIIATVGDWDYRKYGGTKESPVLVNTTEKIFFTKESEGIIGYGEYILQESTEGWVEVTIPIDYRSLTRKPTHIMVICAASIRGDYLTGSSRSTLWVDDFDLIYDDSSNLTIDR